MPLQWAPLLKPSLPRLNASASSAGEAFKRAQESDKTYVIAMQVDPYEGWTAEGHTWWEVGTPRTSTKAGINAAHAEVEDGRKRQRRGI